MLAGSFLFSFILLVAQAAARPLYPLPSKVANGLKQPLQTFRPYNIAHRGSNGEIPEETAFAYMVNIPTVWNPLVYIFICFS